MSNPVKKLREVLGLSQVAFGELIARCYQSVRNYEGGIRPSTEVIQKLKTIAVECGYPEIAKELSDEEWAVKQDGTIRISQVPKNLHPEERGFGAELHSLLDDILQSPNIQIIEATQSALRVFAKSVRQPPVPVDRPRRRRV